MSSLTPDVPSSSRRSRFDRAVQESRALVYLAATAIGLALRALGVLDVPYGAALAVGGIGLLSALLLRGLFRPARRRALARVLTPLWLGVDIALVSWIVAVTGGHESPWFPWYVAIISAAAFVAGQMAAFAAFVASTGAYVVALVAAGDVTGIDQAFWNGVGVMVCLYAASYFFLRGAVMLKQKSEQIRAMEKESRRKVEELTRLTEALEDRGGELREANLRLREADRLKTQFLANVSHELRTPLNSIIGFSEILGTQLREELDERQKRFLDYIHTAGEELLSIINDILDLSKIEAGTLEMAPEKIPVASSLHGVRTILKGTAKKRDVKIVVEIEENLPIVEADPVRFKQMVYHLLSNAVKFSHPGEEVRVEARPLGADESPLGVDCVEIRVTDQGVGIDPEQQESIFEAFRQADGTASREFQGAGLGLALVKRVVELHRGLVGVESRVGKGSTFSVLWPVEYRGKPASGGDVTLPDAETAEDGRRILIVEDDPTAFETLRRPLEKAGFRSVRARSGEEALEMARKYRPAAITLDLVLPGIDGLKVLRRLRSDPETKEVPVVIVSLLDNRELGLALGADDYLVKPVDEDILSTRLRELVPDSEPVGTRRVLVIDDDPALHEMLESVLPRETNELLHALSGAEGLEIAREDRVDVVVLDLMMEEMDGFEVASALKRDGKTRDLPIVVLTAKDMSSGDRERLHDKIEALVKKGGSRVGKLDLVIEQALRRIRVREQGSPE